MAKDCPKCATVNPPEAQRCDCGYDFVKGTVEQAQVRQAQVRQALSAGHVLLLGASCSIIGAFPLAALVAWIYGFPVPFGGKLSGPEAMLPSQFAVLFYGLVGGFVVLGLLGAGAGALAVWLGWLGGFDSTRVTWLTMTLSLLFSAACVILLAILDLIIGPW